MITYYLVTEAYINLIYALLLFATIGFFFTILVIVGVVLNGLQSGIALDQWLGTCLIKGAKADETISAWAHRNHHKRTERLINWLFRDPLHCAKAYLSEVEGSQNAPEYQNGKGA